MFLSFSWNFGANNLIWNNKMKFYNLQTPSVSMYSIMQFTKIYEHFYEPFFNVLCVQRVSRLKPIWKFIQNLQDKQYRCIVRRDKKKKYLNNQLYYTYWTQMLRIKNVFVFLMYLHLLIYLFSILWYNLLQQHYLYFNTG